MGVNRVTMNTPDGEQTVMDITDTSATPETVADGVVFYGADGERKTGTALGGIPVPETAAVGQTVAVRAVDENGKPIEWEAADFPKGGGVTGEVVRPKDLQEYTPKHYLKTLGMLSGQDGSVLPSISGEWSDVAYGDGVTVMVASGTNIAARKVDGKLWEAVTLPHSGDWCSVVYFKPEKAFIAVDNSGYWALSFDMGATWVDGEEETGVPWASAGDWIAFSTDTQCVFQDRTGLVWPSVWCLDGASDIYAGFEQANCPTGSFVYVGGKFVLAVGNQVGFCTDIRYGEWEWVDLPEGVVIDEIAYTEGMFMGYSNGNGIYYSEDGVNWLVHDSFPSSAITYPNGMTMVGEIESVVACNGRFLFFVPGAQSFVLSVPANDVYGWDFLTWGTPAVWQWFGAAGGRFISLLYLEEDFGNWSAGVPFVLYSDDGLTLTPTVPKLTAQSGGGGSYSDWSEADKDAMAEYVIAKLPVYNGEVEDV